MEGYGYPNPEPSGGYMVEGFEFALTGSNFVLKIVPVLVFWRPLIPVETNWIVLKIVIVGSGSHIKNLVFEMELNECPVTALSRFGERIGEFVAGQSTSLTIEFPEPSFECRVSRDSCFPTGWSMTCIAATPRLWEGFQPTLKHDFERGAVAGELCVTTAFDFDSLANARSEIVCFLRWLEREAIDIERESGDKECSSEDP